MVYFSRNAQKLGEQMSLAAKVRIAWGGKDAVEAVAAYPSMTDCQTVIFGPKLSYAVIAKEELSSELEAKKLARRVSVDVAVFDQAGCASPHNLYIECGGEISPEHFCEILAENFPKTEIQIRNQLFLQNRFLPSIQLVESMISKVRFGEATQCHGLSCFLMKDRASGASLFTLGS